MSSKRTVIVDQGLREQEVGAAMAAYRLLQFWKKIMARLYIQCPVQDNIALTLLLLHCDMISLVLTPDAKKGWYKFDCYMCLFVAAQLVNGWTDLDAFFLFEHKCCVQR